LEFPPPPALAPFIERFWTLEGPASATAADPAPVFPDGRMELVVHYGDPFARVDRRGCRTLQNRRLVAGQMTAPIRLVPTGRIGVVAARFRPEGARALLRLALDDLTDLIVDLDDVLRLERLQEAVEAAPDAPARVGALASVLLLRLAAAPAPDHAVGRARMAIERAAGRASIDAAARAAGLTPRGLERAFRRDVGLSPKLYSRIVRFQCVLSALSDGSSMNGAELADACGYYDQSHLCRDIKAFTGAAPSALELERPMTAFFIRATSEGA
jgi:AraC-like DNA-binding protein